MPRPLRRERDCGRTRPARAPRVTRKISGGGPAARRRASEREIIPRLPLHALVATCGGCGVCLVVPGRARQSGMRDQQLAERCCRVDVNGVGAEISEAVGSNCF